MPLKSPFLTLVLLAVWPFVSFLNNNHDDALIYGANVSAYALGFGLVVVLIALIGVVLFGRSRSTAVAHVCGIASVLLFSYLPLSGFLSGLGISLGTIRIAIWAVVSLLILFAVWRLARSETAARVLLAAAGVMVVVPVVGLGLFAVSGTETKTEKVEVAKAGNEARRENVYWFIFDAYARADALADYFGYDNSAFLGDLERRGFDVASRALANYASTKLSISTTADMNYFLPEGAPLHPSMWTARLQGFNPTVEAFKAMGYRYIHAEPGGNNLKTRCGGNEDVCVTAPTGGAIGVSEAEVGLLRLTPLFPIIRRLLPDLLSFDFTNIADVMERIAPTPGKPTFLFAHILSPHPPQRFDENCGHLVNVEFDLAGEDYSDLVDVYLNDLTCLNAEIVSMVDQIVADDPGDPYIILQSDHGFRSGLVLEPRTARPGVPPAFVAYANLHAMRAPESCDTRTGEGFSPVNTFRIVLSCIDGEPRELLPGRQFRNENGALHAFEPDARPKQ
ncbi:MAG: sulfatase-like hydrolase/transferase [Rhodospirillaceae bacterium]|jgi:hypothetical protein|nr:sulfatase-like hydrolase/transferase [Rhodospirillaceae bacterium]